MKGMLLCNKRKLTKEVREVEKMGYLHVHKIIPLG